MAISSSRQSSRNRILRPRTTPMALAMSTPSRSCQSMRGPRAISLTNSLTRSPSSRRSNLNTLRLMLPRPMSGYPSVPHL